jgi:serine/threonine protein kinase
MHAFPDPDEEWTTFEAAINTEGYAPWALDAVGASEDFRDLIGHLLTPDPSDRWTASEALAHPFYANEAQQVADACTTLIGIPGSFADPEPAA